jgi:hypothetical protein
MSTPLTCPYCNSFVPVPAGAREGVRVPCPRCGEGVLYRGGGEDPAGRRRQPPEGVVPAAAVVGTTASRPVEHAPPGADSPASPAEPRVWGIEALAERLRGWSKGAIALAVLGVMGTMATVGLFYALWTVKFRRDNDRVPVEPARVQVVAPADLTGLGYLPPGCNVVVGVHVAEAMLDPAGREFLTHFQPLHVLGQDAGENGDAAVDRLEKLTGLGLQDIDHAVLGLNAASFLSPHPVLVVQARRPLDHGKIATALRARLTAEGVGRELYRVPVEKSSVEALLWFADDRTLVLGLSANDLNALPSRPRPGIDHLAENVRVLLRDHVSTGTQAWVAADTEKVDRKLVPLLLAGLPGGAKGGPEKETLEKVRAAGAWLQFGAGLRFYAAVGCADDDTAARVEHYLVPPEGAERKPLRILGDRPETRAVAEELRQTLKAVRGDGWVTVQAKAAPETVRAAFPK